MNHLPESLYEYEVNLTLSPLFEKEDPEADKAQAAEVKEANTILNTLKKNFKHVKSAIGGDMKKYQAFIDFLKKTTEMAKGKMKTCKIAYAMPNTKYMVCLYVDPESKDKVLQVVDNMKTFGMEQALGGNLEEDGADNKEEPIVNKTKEAIQGFMQFIKDIREDYKKSLEHYKTTTLKQEEKEKIEKRKGKLGDFQAAATK